ncbi:FHA domain-containing protein [Cellulomonas sp. URHB0016]
MTGARQGAFAPVDDPPDLARRSGGSRVPVPVELDAFVPAAGARRAWLLLDVVLLVVVPAALGVAQVWVGVVAVVAAVTAGVAGLLRTGRTPAHRVLGLRTVGRTTALPPTVRELLGADAVSLDVRQGTDPLRFEPRPRAAVPVVRVDPWAADGGRTARAVLMLDDGTVVTVPVPTVLGRNPVPSGPGAVAVRVTDLSRTLSRSHVEVAPHDDGLLVTDLGSANGTAVAMPGAEFEMLAPGATAVVPVGGRLVIGDRTMVVADRSAVEVP